VYKIRLEKVNGGDDCGTLSVVGRILLKKIL